MFKTEYKTPVKDFVIGQYCLQKHRDMFFLTLHIHKKNRGMHVNIPFLNLI